MVPCDTRTGFVLEKMIITSLGQGSYTYEKQADTGGGYFVLQIFIKSIYGSHYKYCM